MPGHGRGTAAERPVLRPCVDGTPRDVPSRIGFVGKMLPIPFCNIALSLIPR